MTQEELRAKLESYDTKGATLKQLIADRDIAKEAQMQLQRSHKELRNYNIAGGFDTPTDEVRDCMIECLHAIADEGAMYGAFVSRASEEIYKRLDK